MKKKICLNCGFARVTKQNKDPKAHKCKKSLPDLKCLDEYKVKQCTFNALTCQHKKVDPDVKSKINDKLKIELFGYLALIKQIGNIPESPVAAANIQVDANSADERICKFPKAKPSSYFASLKEKQEVCALFLTVAATAGLLKMEFHRMN